MACNVYNWWSSTPWHGISTLGGFLHHGMSYLHLVVFYTMACNVYTWWSSAPGMNVMLCYISPGSPGGGQGQDVHQVWTLTSTNPLNIRVFWSNQHREWWYPVRPIYTKRLPCRGLWEDAHGEKFWGHKWQKILWCENRVVNLQRMFCIPDLSLKRAEIMDENHPAAPEVHQL